jgi:hypothetical protein
MPDICSGRQGRTAAEGSQVSFHAYSGCPCCPKRNPQFSHSAFKFFCPSFCVASVACGDGQSFSSNRHACEKCTSFIRAKVSMPNTQAA